MTADTTPATEAGRRLYAQGALLLSDEQQMSADRVSLAERLAFMDAILAIEAEAYAAGFAHMKSACHDEKADFAREASERVTRAVHSLHIGDLHSEGEGWCGEEAAAILAILTEQER